MMKRFQYFISNRHKVLIFGILCLFAICLVAQNKKSNAKTITPTTKPSKKGTKVFLEYADALEFDKSRGADYQVLRGAVRFRQDSMRMYCDSAYFFDKTNSLEAFGNIRMEQGDTLFVYSDYLFYDGNMQLAKLRKNVKMENRNVTLLTDSLNYDRRMNVGYFFEGGVVSDLKNELTSVYGQYSPSTKNAFFQYKVKLVNEQMTLTSDTLHYNTQSKIADIVSPTKIVSDSNVIYTKLGRYNTIKETAVLLNRSLLVSKAKTLTGDTILYFRNTGKGKVRGNMHLKDTLNKTDLFGKYGYYNEKTHFSFATDSAWVREYSRPDTIFMHADTLMLTEPDTTFRVMSAYHHVRFYSNESQGVCDSLRYSTKDSVLRLFKNPILWNTKYQLSGDTIHAFMNDSTIDHAHIIGYAFVATQEDSVGGYYNQLSGKELKAKFENGEARKIDVIGNVESVFYPTDKDSLMIGLNRAESSYLTMYVYQRKLEKMIMWPSPKGSLTPMVAIKQEEKFLKNFRWQDAVRPRNSKDIFRIENTTSEPIKRIHRRVK
ncbi:MAG: OstA-like protein [Bacteroidales bacterium]|nr:OstA-like protein [Bacteroidales bacterium]